MLEMMLGCTFENKLLDGIKRLNDLHDNIKIVELYGSIKHSVLGSARPLYRLPDISYDRLTKFVKDAKAINVSLNYTLNLSCFGSLKNLKDKENEIKQFLKFLEDIGIERVTVTNPLLMEIVTNTVKIPIEISTIFHLYSISQLLELKKRYNVDKLCMNVMYNRNFSFLKKINKIANDNNMTVELMLNEFCNFVCVDRHACYQIHGHTVDDERALYDDYPMRNCKMSKRNNPVEWLKTRFIRPEDLMKYVEVTGINKFKCTGRTGDTDYLLWVAEQYMNMKYEGNLIALWFQLENIGPNKWDLKNPDYVNIPNEKLDGFLDYWIKASNYDCFSNCGVNCTYCDDFYNKIKG